MGLFLSLKKAKQPQPAASAGPSATQLILRCSPGSYKEATEEKLSQISDFPAGSSPFSREIAEGLYATDAADAGPAWEFVSTDSVGDFGGTEQLYRVAVDNLRRRGDIRIEGGNGRFALTVPDEMDMTASVLLDPERWRAAVTIPGDLVAAAPTRLSIWDCSTDDTDSIDKLIAVAAHGFTNGEGKPVSPDLLQLSGTVLFRWAAR